MDGDVFVDPVVDAFERLETSAIQQIARGSESPSWDFGRGPSEWNQRKSKALS
jgi:hypothetical protein